MSKIFVSTGVVATKVESVKRYMSEIKKTPVLSRADEQAAAEAKDINRLVTANLRFVVQVAKQYQGMGLELEDLISYGNLGLFEAAERFDATRNIKFITFAVWYIRAEITKALNDDSRVVRIPSHRTKDEEYSTISTSTVIGEDEDSETYADRYLPADPGLAFNELEDLKLTINSALNRLKPKEAQAVKLYYGIDIEFPRCIEEISSIMGVTNERARQLVRAGEESLRTMSGIEILEQYL